MYYFFFLNLKADHIIMIICPGMPMRNSCQIEIPHSFKFMYKAAISVHISRETMG